ncbi:cysteine protease ATG4 [Aspergillus fumigatus Af293]|uniref:Cysteine protease n=1 Tax=Aspergillus fumigatus (strain ATCC MYA-4609 / CBS 101355 / FGSC A1100 / Af293) TaxID=330879 RepID=Q4WWC4_ASPFU|nr:autophagy cysteine endopeptidase Atg4, putative [Aspergillus fumigatus Af293]EAL93029.1 autophagy cysteine endopeptidase Atg4, putative [Aspergillus fumigatus Af293]
MTDDTADVYEDKFLDAANDGRGSFRPTLILIGTRLGIDRITPVYWDAVKTTLQLPQSVGIAGGRPSASHYFVGVQGSHLFYLDPHQTRPALPQRNIDDPYTDEEIETYHTRRLRRIHIRDMDPSMLIGFIIKDREDWAHWKSGVSAQEKPIVHVLSESNTAVFKGREGAIDEIPISGRGRKIVQPAPKSELCYTAFSSRMNHEHIQPKGHQQVKKKGKISNHPMTH